MKITTDLLALPPLMFFDLNGMTVASHTRFNGYKEFAGFYMYMLDGGMVSLWGRTMIGGDSAWIADYADGMGYVVGEVPV